MRNRLADQALATEVSSFSHFYGAQLPEGTVARFSLIFRSDATGPTNGQQLQGIAAVEFRPDEHPDDRIGTLVHEFCHFLYNSRPVSKDAALQARFVASGNPAAKPSLNLMNETLATTLGNGIVGQRYTSPERWVRRMQTPRSLYNDDEIDRASKRLLPTLEAFISSGGSMDDSSFTATYLNAIKAEFGDDILRPSGMLKEAFVFTESRFGKGFSRQVVRAMHIAGAYREEAAMIDEESLGDFSTQPNLSAIFVVCAARLDELVARGVITREDSEALRDALAHAKSATLGRGRTTFSTTYLVVAEDPPAALEGVKQLQARTTPLIGLLR
jgi:hypothetical protein